MSFCEMHLTKCTSSILHAQVVQQTSLAVTSVHAVYCVTGTWQIHHAVMCTVGK